MTRSCTTSASTIRFAPSAIAALVRRLGRSLTQRPRPKDGRRGDEIQRHGGRLGRLRKRHSGLTRCSKHLLRVNSHGSVSGASPRTAFVHVGRSTVGGKRAGPNCGLRVNARGRFVASFTLFPGPASALAVVPFFGSFLSQCRHLPSRTITSSNCNSRRGCHFVRRTNVRTCIGCGHFRVRLHPQCGPGPFRRSAFRCGTSRSCCMYPVKRRVAHVNASRSGATDKCQDRGTECETRGYGNYPLQYLYCETGNSEHAVRIGRQLGQCGRGTQRQLASRRNVERENEQYVRPRTIFKRVGCSVTCGQFQRFKGSGIGVSFTFFTVTFGVGGVYSEVTGRERGKKGGPGFSLFLDVGRSLAFRGQVFKRGARGRMT